MSPRKQEGVRFGARTERVGGLCGVVQQQRDAIVQLLVDRLGLGTHAVGMIFGSHIRIDRDGEDGMGVMAAVIIRGVLTWWWKLKAMSSDSSMPSESSTRTAKPTVRSRAGAARGTSSQLAS